MLYIEIYIEKFEHYIFDSTLCCIQAGRKSLGVIIKNIADSIKML